VISVSGKCDSNLSVSRVRVHLIQRINLLVSGRKGTPKMRDDLYSKTHDQEQRFQALARKCRLDEADEDKALGVYHSMIDAIADSIEARANRIATAPPPTTVYIAAYRHRFGVDLSAHATQEEAESRLLEIAWQQCMRDASIRAAVDARFGPLVADQPPLEPPFPADEYQPDVDSWWDPPLDTAQSSESDTLLASPHEAQSQRVCAGDNSPGQRRTFREQLLEEWPQLSGGEQLWIECCTVEREEALISFDTDEADDSPPAYPNPPGSFRAASPEELRSLPKQQHA
jgi:hypothetical protein